MNRGWVYALILAIGFIAGPGLSQDAARHQLGAKKTAVVPEQFLRAFDPITVFFNKSMGPDGGGSLDVPGSLLQIRPAHPGEYRWLDARTLQFLPTIPWPALEKFEITVPGASHRLVTLMAAPTRMRPAAGATDLEPFRDFDLIFAHRIAPERLAEMITIEVKPLPGLSTERGYRLSKSDFAIKEIERAELAQDIAYQLTLNEPIPYGRRVTLNFRLSLSETLPEHFTHYDFFTKPLFRLTGVGIGPVLYPIAVNGSVYSREQAIDGGSSGQSLFLEFSDRLGAVQLADVKQMARFEPAVKNFRFEVSGRRLRLIFEPEHDRAYRLTLQPAPIADQTGRTLARFGETSVWFFYPPATPYLSWRQGQGILERFGPQQLPMEGRGLSEIDLRIYKIDPLNLNFWPFPATGVLVVEDERPPTPGEEPAYGEDMANQIKLLGSPLISRFVALPLKSGGSAGRFGLDLRAPLAEISGAGQPGTYLVGYRPIHEDSSRLFARVQVTDLSLTVVEGESEGGQSGSYQKSGEPSAVVHGTSETRNRAMFSVTSLKTGQPVAGAKIVVEGFFGLGDDRAAVKNSPQAIISGTTDENGFFEYIHTKSLEPYVFRIMVSKGADMLVLDPFNPPPKFFDNHWYGEYNTFLSWVNQSPPSVYKEDQTRAFVFPERPVYRPEEPVHLRGFVRQRQAGKLRTPENRQLNLVIQGPGEKEWTFPIQLGAGGDFYVRFDEAELPTGNYTARVYPVENRSWVFGSAQFKKEAYRIPRFEVKLTGPDPTPLDQPFEVTLTADYYAGGRVVGQEVNWSVTRFAHRPNLPEYSDYLFSTDERFGQSPSEPGESATTRIDVTDESGSAKLEIDPTLEIDSRPRRYLVEASVRGADEQTVSANKSVIAMPAFLLGLKTARFIESGQVIQATALVLGPDGKPLVDKEFQVKLLQRQWHSYLRESDFTTGEAKYVTEVVDQTLSEETYRSTSDPLNLTFPVKEAGVYIVELTSRDRLGRRQKVFADLFVKGDTPVAWEKPKDWILETAWDKPNYLPGEQARLLLKSPFQEAEATIVVEAPGGNRYHRVPVRNGQGLFVLPVEPEMALKIPIHVLLMRGRLDASTGPGSRDFAKPMTLAATAWLMVKPSGFRAELALEHERKQLPGSSMPMIIKLSDPDGNPLNGTVTLWLVDRAVLALGREARLDPVPAFIEDHPARVRLRDSRNDTLGAFSFEELPGGDGAEEDASPFDRVTVRRNFQTVPYYEPAIRVVNGEARIQIPLPDNLTDFAVRAVAFSGEERFGMARSTVSIRLPLIIQSALPRFVRPGDRFEAGGIGRLVEGDGGPGAAEIQVEGLTLAGETRRPVEWVKDLPRQVYFPMTVTAEPAAAGEAPNHVTVRLAVSRQVDGAADAFEVKLPVLPDRERTFVERLVDLEPGKPLELPHPGEAFRPGTASQSVILTGRAVLVKLLAGLDFNTAYPYGCTEQRISQLYPEMALRDLLLQIDRGERLRASQAKFGELITHLEQSQGPHGLFGFWPGADGQVSLTAYVTEFLLLARRSGLEFPAKILDRALNALQESLRSDYPHTTRGYEYFERADALAALAQAGRFDQAYAFDLAARAQSVDLYSEAKILYTMTERGFGDTAILGRIADDLRNQMVFALQDGREVFRGLQYRDPKWDGPVLASEVKTVAGVARALYRRNPADARVQSLIDDLILRGDKDGWGDTNANAAALLALAEVMKLPERGAETFLVRVGDRELRVGTDGALITSYRTDQPHRGPIERVSGTDAANGAPLHAWLRLNYLPVSPGSSVTATQNGFAVERELLVFADLNAPPGVEPIVAGGTVQLPTGVIVEEHVRVVNPEDRFYAAISVPFAAGFEPLNPGLATAPPEAQPRGQITLRPTYAQYADDRTTFFYDFLPKGTYDFYFRLRASIAGSFTQPPARAELMYRQAVQGHSHGAIIKIIPRTE